MNQPLLTFGFSCMFFVPHTCFSEERDVSRGSGEKVTVQKQTFSDSSEFGKGGKNWSLSLGSGVFYWSLFNGGATRNFFALPVVEGTYQNWSFGLEGIGYRLIEKEDFSAGVLLGYDFGRRDRRDTLPERACGIGDVGGGVAGSMLAEYEILMP